MDNKSIVYDKHKKAGGEIHYFAPPLCRFIGLRQTAAYSFHRGCPMDSTGILSLKILLLCEGISAQTAGE